MWILTTFRWTILKRMSSIAKDGLRVHSSLNPRECRSILESCIRLRLKTWLPWTPSIDRAQWTTYRSLLPERKVLSRLSMTSQSWKSIWRIHMELQYIRSKSCCCRVCWLISRAVSRMVFARQWVRRFSLNWRSWRFGQIGKSLHRMPSTRAMPHVIVGWLSKQHILKQTIHRNIWRRCSAVTWTTSQRWPSLWMSARQWRWRSKGRMWMKVALSSV